MGRETLRKRIIRSILAERPSILLDELRWTVLSREAGGKVKAVTVSQATSLARTVREHMPELNLWDVPIGDGSECGALLIAATAVFRIRQKAKLDAFLSGPSPVVSCRYVTDLPVHEFGENPRYRYSNFVVPYYHLHLIDLYPSKTAARFERIKIAPSHKVTIVGTRSSWDSADVLARQTWRVVSQDEN